MDDWIDVVGGLWTLDSYLIVVRRQLMEQLFDAVFLSRAVHIGHLVLWQGAVVLMNLSRRHSDVEQKHTCKMITSCSQLLLLLSTWRK